MISPQTLALALLLALRVLPLAWLLPTATQGSVSWPLASVLGLALGLLLLPLGLSTAHPALSWDLTLLPHAASELGRGLVLALAVSLPLHAFAWTGELIDLMRGASAAPFDDGMEPVLGPLYRYGALAVFFASGSHRIVIEALAESLQHFPLGSLPDTSSLGSVVLSLTGLVSRALSLSLELAAPVLLCVIVLQLLLGALSRVSAQLSAQLIQGPIVPALGLCVACLTASLVLSQTPTALRVFVRQAELILNMLD